MVAVVVPAGTVTVLVAPDLPGMKLVTFEMFGATNVMLKSVIALHPVKQVSTVVMSVMVLKRSEGIVVSFVALENADLKFWMWVQLVRSPFGMDTNALHFSKHC